MAENLEPVLAMNQPAIRLIICPNMNPEKDRTDCCVSAEKGKTIRDHLLDLGWQPDSLNARVSIDGELVNNARWEYAIPRGGQTLVIRVIPCGGEGGGKAVLRIIAVLGVIVASFFTAGGGLAGLAGYFGGAGAWAGMLGGSVGASLAAAAVSIVGSVRINALIPPQTRRHLS